MVSIENYTIYYTIKYKNAFTVKLKLNDNMWTFI